ncbi:MAG: ferritin-like domain-containing protein [Candidatus Methanofastidiosia archaeon]|jgi:bacterioferritin
MGTKAREIVGMDVDTLIDMLNKALADEWLAYYQYWIGAKVIKGPMRDAAAVELLEHAQEELMHADLIAERIIKLGGTPLLTPKDWYTMTTCGYNAPADPFVKTIVKQNIEGEQCAIDVYREFLDTVKDKDPITYNMVLQILEDEIEHEEDLQAILEDIELIGK